MIYTIYHENGDILAVYHGSHAIENSFEIETDIAPEVLSSQYFVKDGDLRFKGITPPYYLFDKISQTNVFQKENAVKAITQRLKAEVSRVATQNIIVSGHEIDADFNSFTALQLNEVACRTNTVISLTWRLADNSEIVFGSVAEMHTFVLSAISAISARNTTSMQRLWNATSKVRMLDDATICQMAMSSSITFEEIENV